MASPINLTTVVPTADPPTTTADRAWSAVVDEFEACEQALSRFRQMSAVTRLNQAAQRGEALSVDRRTAVAAHACDRARRVTDGRFDPRIVGHLDAWGYRGAVLDPPVSLSSLAAPERIVERVDHDRIRLPHPIDLGGIGKGLAVRWAADRVRRVGVDRFLLDAGGDIVARGAGPDRGPWLIGIEDPMGGSDPVAVVAIRDGAIATSSIRRLRWTVDGQERHHLVDPATGQPADGALLAVTVAASDPAWAEVWSKALFITGRRAIGAEARARGLAAWWVTTDRVVEMTPAARIATVWVAGEA
jgi:thiamine biosynthesis lipoprotein